MKISWDQYFIKMAFLVSERSTCLRRQIGAVIVKNHQVIATGYNGACSKMEECIDVGCIRDEKGINSGERHEICRAVHAEQNAIIQAALHGTSTEGATMYCTHSPCILCAKMIVNAKIERVVCAELYSEQTFRKLFEKAGIEFCYEPFQ